MDVSKGVCIESLKSCVGWLWVVTLHFASFNTFQMQAAPSRKGTLYSAH
jgi:hypothetical protein